MVGRNQVKRSDSKTGFTNGVLREGGGEGRSIEEPIPTVQFMGGSTLWPPKLTCNQGSEMIAPCTRKSLV